MMKNILALCALVTLCGCDTARYYRPDVGDLETYSSAQLKGCMYDAYRADHWGDDAYLDQCMASKGFTVADNGVHAIWRGRSDFEKYGAEKKSPGR